MDKKSIEIDPPSNHSEVELQDWIEEQQFVTGRTPEGTQTLATREVAEIS